LRWPADDARPQRLTALANGEPWELGPATLTAFPAAHILGASLVLVEHEGHRLVYTGDVKLRAPLCGAPTRMPPCDTLIIESTFGLPLFQFIDREVAAERITTFAAECLARRELPVFLGYPLGRGQELAHVLAQAGIATSVHGAIAKFFPIYEAQGHGFGAWSPYDREASLAQHALVTVPGHAKHLPANARVAAVSGWASLHNARLRYQADELIPYSDHGDFHELLELVRQSQARRVFVVHGYAEALARYLTDRLGIDAQPAGGAVAREEE
jgi:Cft2 family RNA processing exonuclease